MFSLKPQYKKSYSQSGEDVIVDRILTLLRIKNPTYLDIGANDPILINNTYLFYKKGFNGINIEPDPFLFKKLKAKRQRDTNLNIGIGTTNGRMTFYIMSSNTLSTFSKETALQYVSYGNQKIESEISVDVVDVNEIVEKYFRPKPNYVSLDVEGLDAEILKCFNFERHRPEVFCVETLTYTENNSESKLSEIIEYMNSMGYMVHSDTYINTIFVDSKSWKKRGT